MSTDYRNSSQRKLNAVQKLEVEMFTRLNAASEVCDRLLKAAGRQIDDINQHVKAGGDIVEALMGSEDYDKMVAESASGSVAPAVGENAPSKGSGTFSELPEKEPDPRPDPKRRYLPRIKAPPIYVLLVRVAELQRELVPLVQGMGDALIDAGVDVMRILKPDLVAQAVREEFGIELEDIDDATYDLMVDTITKTQQWLREFKEKHAQEIAAKGAPPPGKDAATDGA